MLFIIERKGGWIICRNNMLLGMRGRLLTVFSHCT
jgi:hypothetical protein